jgi:hypothetical protein
VSQAQVVANFVSQDVFIVDEFFVDSNVFAVRETDSLLYAMAIAVFTYFKRFAECALIGNNTHRIRGQVADGVLVGVKLKVHAVMPDGIQAAHPIIILAAFQVPEADGIVQSFFEGSTANMVSFS